MEYGQLLFYKQYADVAIDRVKKMIYTTKQQHCVLVKTKQAKDEIISLIQKHQLRYYQVNKTDVGYVIEFNTKLRE